MHWKYIGLRLNEIQIVKRNLTEDRSWKTEEKYSFFQNNFMLRASNFSQWNNIYRN